jgi:hypothetical protein
VARSTRLRELQTRITELRVRALPAQFDETGAYADRIFDRTRGFRVLAHAEIEACLEDLGVETVNAAFQGWSTDQKPRTTLTALMTFARSKGLGVPDELQTEPRYTLRGRLDDVRKAYVNWVKTENHGVRESNVLGILLPTGIREHEIDRAWLERIDSFGSARGNTAHRAGRPQAPPDPKSELETVRSIVNGLVPIDARLSALRTE